MWFLPLKKGMTNTGWVEVLFPAKVSIRNVDVVLAYSFKLWWHVFVMGAESVLRKCLIYFSIPFFYYINSMFMKGTLLY